MITVKLAIDGRSVSVPAGCTILAAARSLGIEIPTLCHREGSAPHTSCMICVVWDRTTERLLPACSSPAVEGMDIDTSGERVREARRDTLDLLLSEHVGDCEAPCQRACPAGMNIPLTIRQIGGGALGDAIVTIKNHIALPAVLGRICPAPCEKACRRRQIDAPVAICALKRFAADNDLAEPEPYRPALSQKSGKHVAVVGAGPAGLSAAYYIARYGHGCRVFDRNAEPGGLLRYAVPDNRLPKDVLDADIEQIRALGVEFATGQALGTDLTLRGLIDEYDAVVLATGKTDTALLAGYGFQCASDGIAIDRKTFETSMQGVFAGGNIVSEGKMAVRSAAHGRSIARSVNLFLSGLTVTATHRDFNSMMGNLIEGEAEEFLGHAAPYERVEPSGGPDAGFSLEEAERESRRCLHCDCRKPSSCALRRYADEYGAHQRRYRYGERKRFVRAGRHGGVVFEQGKCIKCNICIDIAKQAGERLGLTFVGRGFDVRVAAPFDETIEDGLEKTAAECIESCPTGALAWRDAEEEAGECFD